MKIKILMSVMTFFVGALIITASLSTNNSTEGPLFVSDDNIAEAYMFGGCVTANSLCDPPDQDEVFIKRRWVSNQNQ